MVTLVLGAENVFWVKRRSVRSDLAPLPPILVVLPRVSGPDSEGSTIFILEHAHVAIIPSFELATKCRSYLYQPLRSAGLVDRAFP